MSWARGAAFRPSQRSRLGSRRSRVRGRRLAPSEVEPGSGARPGPEGLLAEGAAFRPPLSPNPSSARRHWTGQIDQSPPPGKVHGRRGRRVGRGGQGLSSAPSAGPEAFHFRHCVPSYRAQDLPQNPWTSKHFGPLLASDVLNSPWSSDCSIMDRRRHEHRCPASVGDFLGKRLDPEIVGV